MSRSLNTSIGKLKYVIAKEKETYIQKSEYVSLWFMEGLCFLHFCLPFESFRWCSSGTVRLASFQVGKTDFLCLRGSFAVLT